MLLLWSLLSFMNREIVPDPVSSFAYMLQLKSYDLIENISITLANSVEGFLIALLLSMLLLSASHASSIVKSIINSMNTVLQSVSVLVWTIIFVLIFGVLSRMPSILVTAVTGSASYALKLGNILGERGQEVSGDGQNAGSKLEAGAR
jgi:NitT/TauT family transport system permease protein